MQMGRILAAALTATGIALPVAAQEQPFYGKRDNLFVVTSTLTRAYVDAISERFSREYGYPRPVVKTTIANVAVDAFCGGIGAEYPDAVAVPRRISRGEYARCIKNGILDIVELNLGSDALVVATKKGDPIFDLKLTTFFYALAGEVPGGAGYFENFKPNTVERWSQIDSKLPDLPIKVLGPAADTAILKFMKDFFMEGACRQIGPFKVYYQAEERVKQCTTLRADGAFAEVKVPIARNFIEPMRQSAPGTLVILPYTVWREHRDWLDVLPVEGVEPSKDTIAGFSYVPVYPVRLYVKRAHMRQALGGFGVVDGLYELLHETVSDEAIAPGGYLEAVGLVADSVQDRADHQRAALRLERYVR